jgi:hypothetical protein
MGDSVPLDSAPRPVHFIPERQQAALVCLHLEQIQGNVPVESLEEGDAVTDQDGIAQERRHG